MKNTELHIDKKLYNDLKRKNKNFFLYLYNSKKKKNNIADLYNLKSR